jgi:hypothetical protein
MLKITSPCVLKITKSLIILRIQSATKMASKLNFIFDWSRTKFSFQVLKNANPHFSGSNLESLTRVVGDESALLQQIRAFNLKFLNVQSGWPDWANFFPLSSFFKITEVSQIYRLFFPNVLVIYLFWRNTGFGDSFGDFFTNSSGHHAYNLKHIYVVVHRFKK